MWSLAYDRCCDELLARFHHTLQLALLLSDGSTRQQTKGCKQIANPLHSTQLVGQPCLLFRSLQHGSQLPFCLGALLPYNLTCTACLQWYSLVGAALWAWLLLALNSLSCCWCWTCLLSSHLASDRLLAVLLAQSSLALDVLFEVHVAIAGFCLPPDGSGRW